MTNLSQHVTIFRTSYDDLFQKQSPQATQSKSNLLTNNINTENQSSETFNQQNGLYMTNRDQQNNITNSNNSYVLTQYYPFYKIIIIKNGTIDELRNSIVFPFDATYEDIQVLRTIELFLKSQFAVLFPDIYLNHNNKQISNKIQTNKFEQYLNKTRMIQSTISQIVSNDNQNLNQTYLKKFIYAKNGTLVESNLTFSFCQNKKIQQSSNSSRSIDVSQNSLSLNTQVKVQVKLIDEVNIGNQRIQTIFNLTNNQTMLNKTIMEFKQFLKEQAKNNNQNINDDQDNQNQKQNSQESLNGQYEDSYNFALSPTQTNSNTRLLQSTNNLRIYKISQTSNSILQTNPYGISIKYQTYSIITIEIITNSINNFKKTTNLGIQTGFYLTIGNKKFTQTLFKASKSFSTLSLVYTYKIIQEGIIQLRQKFNVVLNNTLGQMLLEGTLKEFRGSTTQLANYCQKIFDRVIQEIQMMNTQGLIQQIIQLARDAKDQIQSNLIDYILNKKSYSITQTINDSNTYYHDNYVNALSQWKTYKQINATNFMTQNINSINQNVKNVSILLDEVNKVYQNIPSTQYKDQYKSIILNNASNICKYFEYIVNGSQKYKIQLLTVDKVNIMNSFYSSVKPIFSGYLTKTYENLTLITSIKLQTIQNMSNMDSQKYKSKTTQFNNTLGNKIKDSIKNITVDQDNLLSNKRLAIEFLDSLQSQAIAAKNSAIVQCCYMTWSWQRGDYCGKWNPYDSIRILYNDYINLRNSTKTILNQAIPHIQNIFYQINTLMKNTQNLTTLQMYEKYQNITLQYKYTDLKNLIDLYQVRLNQCNNILVEMCRNDPQPTKLYMNNLTTLQNRIKEIKTHLDLVNNKILDFKNNFSRQDYNNILAKIQLPQALLKLTQQIKNATNQVRKQINNSKNYQKNYTTEDLLLKEKNIIENYLNIFNKIKTKMSYFCSNSTISNMIKKLYDQINNQIFELKYLTLNTKYFQSSIKNFMTILNGQMNNLFPNYKALSVCNYSNQLNNYFTVKAQPLLLQYRKVQQYYPNLLIIWTKNQQQLTKIMEKQNNNTVYKQFYKLRSKGQYIEFLNNTLNSTILIRNLYRSMNSSLQSQKGKYSSLILNNITWTAYLKDRNQTETYIKAFYNSSIRSHSSVFVEASDMKIKALSDANLLNYNVIQYVVTANEQKRILIQTLQFAANNGSQNFTNMTKQTINSIINFKDDLNLTGINKLSQNYTLLIGLINSTIYPSLSNDTVKYKNHYVNSSITNNSTLLIEYNKNYQLFCKYIGLIENNRQYLSSTMKNYSVLLSNQINQTNIKNLLLILNLSDMIKKYDDNFTNYNNIQISKLNDLNRIFIGDFEKVFEADQIQQQVYKNIKIYYQYLQYQINKVINETINNMGTNFRENFKKVKLYKTIQILQLDLVADFTQVDKVVNGLILKMKSKQNQFNGQIRQKIKKLNFLKINFQNIKAITDSTLSEMTQNDLKIKAEAKIIQNVQIYPVKRQITNITDLIISNEIHYNNTIAQTFKNITKLMTLQVIDSISFLREDILKTILLYIEINNSKDSNITKLHKNINNVMNLSTSQQHYDLYYLLKGKEYLNTTNIPKINNNTILKDPKYNTVFYQNMRQYWLPQIKTSIPQYVDYATFNIDFYFDTYVKFGFNCSINNYRNLQCNFNFFKIYLKMNANFENQRPYLYKVGQKISGYLIDGSFYKTQVINGIIPIQYFSTIKDVTWTDQFDKVNVLQSYKFFQGKYSLQKYVYKAVYQTQIRWYKSCRRFFWIRYRCRWYSYNAYFYIVRTQTPKSYIEGFGTLALLPTKQILKFNY